MDTRDLLRNLALAGQRSRLCLSGSKRHIYLLKPLAVDLDGPFVILDFPRGRQTVPDPNESWTLHFREGDASYVVGVPCLEEYGGHLRLILQTQAHLCHRRQTIRLAVDSRNPVKIMFTSQETLYVGLLANISQGGVGVWLKENSPFEVGTTAMEGHFQIHSLSMDFSLARVSHVTKLNSGQLIGLEFLLFSPGCALALRQFLANYDSFSSVSSPETDG